MLDSFCRNITYMRISITSACNLRCRYCSPEDASTGRDKLSADDIKRVIQAACELGITRFRITGGEPLVSPILEDVIRTIKAIDGVATVTLTTNGVLLSEKLPMLKRAGVDGINVSLDTLDRDEFKELTRRDSLEAVKTGIRKAIELGIPTKINTVIRAETDAQRLVDWAAHIGADIRFIEMMPIGYGRSYRSVSYETVKSALEKKYGILSECNSYKLHENGPAVYFENDNLPIRIGFIRPIHGNFCSTCNRIRLTSDGLIKPCLCYKSEYNIADKLGNNASCDELVELLREIIYNKPKYHSFGEPERVSEQKNMISIGG